MAKAKIPRGDHDNIVQRWKAGSSVSSRSRILQDIAREYGVTLSVIYMILKRRGISASTFRPESTSMPEARKPVSPPAVQLAAIRPTTLAVGVRADLLTRGTGRPHYAPLRLPPLPQHAKET